MTKDTDLEYVRNFIYTHTPAAMRGPELKELLWNSGIDNPQLLCLLAILYLK